MRNEFKQSLIKKLTKSFFYCPVNGAPAIQVGKYDSGSFIFHLKYDNSEINKCAALLINELGDELAINDMKEAKDIILKAMSVGFDAIDANFFTLEESDGAVYNILSDVHLSNLEVMFEEYVSSRKKKYPYFYLLRYTKLSGYVDLNANVKLFGNGLIDSLLKDINDNVDIEFKSSILDEPYMKGEQLELYRRHNDTAMVLIYSKSDEDAIYNLNQVFGALCVSIDNPFKINQLTVYNFLGFIKEDRIGVFTARINLPSVYEIVINESAIERIKRLFSSENQRLKSALSFIAHGWTSDERERFMNHFIALDALYGTEYKNRKSIVNGVTLDTASIDDIESKIGTIYDLRSKFIHGEIPSLHRHFEYLKFVGEHGLDPLSTVFHILVECLRNYNLTNQTSEIAIE